MIVLALDSDLHYRRRRGAIAAQAAGPAAQPGDIDYLAAEHQTWATTKRALSKRWDRAAAPEILEAERRLALPTNRLPQLAEVTSQLRRRSGFEFRAVPGLVPIEEFFGNLAEGVFLSTQYVRHPDSPLYTPEPDVLHEVLGHATCLADPHLAMLHREAGAAMVRVETPTARQFIADVFWFSAEFGVLTGPQGPLAYGAGLLSSVGELDAMGAAEIRPLDITAMGTLPYEIDRYQPVLFGASSLTEVLDTVGEFFASATDDTIASRLTDRSRPAGPPSDF